MTRCASRRRAPCPPCHAGHSRGLAAIDTAATLARHEPPAANGEFEPRPLNAAELAVLDPEIPWGRSMPLRLRDGGLGRGTWFLSASSWPRTPYPLGGRGLD